MKHYYFYIIFLAIQFYNSNGVFGQSDVRSDVTTPKNYPVKACITSDIKLTKQYADDLTKTDCLYLAHLPNDIYTLMIFNSTDWEAHTIVKQ